MVGGGRRLLGVAEVFVGVGMPQVRQILKRPTAGPMMKKPAASAKQLAQLGEPVSEAAPAEDVSYQPEPPTGQAADRELGPENPTALADCLSEETWNPPPSPVSGAGSLSQSTLVMGPGLSQE